jgi:hypothetical protein
MKRVVFSLFACVALATTGIAGTYAYKEQKEYKQPYEEPYRCIPDTEWQFDIYGTYSHYETESNLDDGFGGGVGVNYFFHRHIGVGVEGHWNANGEDDTVLHNVAGNVIFRWPLEMGPRLCFAPYLFGGGGAIFDTDHLIEGHVGGGLEYRITQGFGIFGDGRFSWVEDENNHGLFRAGVRFAF